MYLTHLWEEMISERKFCDKFLSPAQLEK